VNGTVQSIVGDSEATLNGTGLIFCQMVQKIRKCHHW